MHCSSAVEGILAALLISITSCSSKDQETTSFKILDESLRQANQTIQNENSTIYAAIEEKLKESRHERKAKVWYPKALLVSQQSNALRQYIESLKDQLKKEAGLHWTNGIELFHEQDENAVETFFLQKGKGLELFKKLNQYKQAVLQVDSTIPKYFKDRLILTSTQQANTENNANAFIDTYFRGQKPVAALAMLSRLQNAVLIAENRLASYCFENSIVSYCGYSSYSALIGQSSTYVKGCEKMTIQAGVGAFSTDTKPEITINGKHISISAEGTAHYTWKAPHKPGKYAIPTQIKFIDGNGNKQTIRKEVEYTVADIKQ